MADDSATPTIGEPIDLSGDGGVLKEIISEGEGPTPATGDNVEAHYTGRLLDGEVFDSSVTRGKKFQFMVGTGQVIKGWDIGFASMRKGEKAFLTCREDYAYGQQAQSSIPAGSTLRFEVELFEFGPKPKEIWEMSLAEKVERAEKLKAEGTAAFKAGSFTTAAVKYNDALACVQAEGDDDDDSEAAEEEGGEPDKDLAATKGALALSCALNAAMCLMKTDPPDWYGVLDSASAALDCDAASLKGLYRRGKAQLELGNTKEAKADLMAAYALDKDNKDVKRALAKLKKAMAAAKDVQKARGAALAKGFGSLFADKTDIAPPPPPFEGELTRCYFDMEVGGEAAGRIEFELYNDAVPRTAENFRALCTGEKGAAAVSGKPLHYKGSAFHRCIKGFMLQGGDFTNGNGTGGESIYGEKFEDEGFEGKAGLHDVKYLLSMANAGPNTNGSQFFITTSTPAHLNGKHVVFGCVVAGQDVVDKIEALPTSSGDKPEQEVVVADCGEIVGAVAAPAAEAHSHHGEG